MSSLIQLGWDYAKSVALTMWLTAFAPTRPAVQSVTTNCATPDGSPMCGSQSECYCYNLVATKDAENGSHYTTTTHGPSLTDYDKLVIGDYLRSKYGIPVDA